MTQFVIFLALYIWLITWLIGRTDFAKHFLQADSVSVWAYAVGLGVIIALVRIWIFWYLMYCGWTGTSLGWFGFPVVYLMLPEAAAMPRNLPPRFWFAGLFSLVLAIGSFGFGLFLALLVQGTTFLRSKLPF